MLVAAWVAAWALARRLPPPVRLARGLRVDVGTAAERVRLVLFDADADAIRDFVRAETGPGATLKVCADAACVTPFLPPRWGLHQPQHIMTAPLATPPWHGRKLPPEFVVTTRVEGKIFHAAIEDRAGRAAAGGRLILNGNHAIVDDVETHPAHRRRGLGAILVARLMGLGGEAGATTGLLVATAAGHRLYAALGWNAHAPYTSAYSP